MIPFLKNSVIFDTETTGLVKHGASTEDERPYVIELGMLRVKDELIVEEFDELIDPGIRIPKRITEITGITDEKIKGCLSFEDLIPEIESFCEGADYMIAYNAPFDCSMMDFEYDRAGMHFKWPRVIDACAEFTPIMGFRPRLEQVYQKFVSQIYQQKHRAQDDAKMIYDVFISCFGGLK